MTTHRGVPRRPPPPVTCTLLLFAGLAAACTSGETGRSDGGGVGHDALVAAVEDSLALFSVDTASIVREGSASLRVEAHLDDSGYRRVRIRETAAGRVAVETVYLDGGLPRVLVASGGAMNLPPDPPGPPQAGAGGRAAALVRIADELLERGGEGTAWILYGFAHLDDGDSTFVRVEVDWDRPAATIADFGAGRVSLADVRVPSDSSALEFSWPGRASAACTLQREGEIHWVGVCRGGAGDRAMELGGDYDPDLGQDLTPSAVDLAILERAAALLDDPARWNRGDDRVCTDDRAADSWSLFCALYQASMDVDGRYLHRRPAMNVPRELIWERAPERVFAHQLRDYNNSLFTTHGEVVDLLRDARSALADRIPR